MFYLPFILVYPQVSIPLSIYFFSSLPKTWKIGCKQKKTKKKTKTKKTGNSWRTHVGVTKQGSWHGRWLPTGIWTSLRLICPLTVIAIRQTHRSYPSLVLGDRMRIPIAVQLGLLVLLTAVSGVAVLAIATVESCNRTNESRVWLF